MIPEFSVSNLLFYLSLQCFRVTLIWGKSQIIPDLVWILVKLIERFRSGSRSEFSEVRSGAR